MESPLAGIKIVDLSQYAPGPYTTKLLCNLGATVLKIEPPNGDPLRNMFLSKEEKLSPVYKALNQGKCITRIDLKNRSSLTRVLKQIEKADILVESYRPGVIEKLGLSYAKCKMNNPGLIYASLSGYGQDGPYRLKAGHDINYAATAGLLSTITPAQPMFPLIADHTGSMNAVNAILSAVIARSRCQSGCYLDLSLYEAMLGWQYFNQSISKHQRHSMGVLTGGAACYNVYQTEDQRVVTLGALEPKFWHSFCVAIQHPEWIERQFESMPQVELIDSLRDLFLSKALAYWVSLFDPIDCCFEPVPLEGAVYQHPQTVSRQLFDYSTHAFPGKFNGRSVKSDSEITELFDGELPDWN